MTPPANGPADSQVRAWLALNADEYPVTEVVISSLSVADSPRMAGEDPAHVQTLAASDVQLPPIIVHYPTMRVIDGMHRVRVAKLRGQEKIAAKFFHGDEEDAFVLAVKSNITHGLPLSLTDRKKAAERIIKSHPQWSDRMIAAVSGLAAKTVSEIRKRNNEPWSASDGRVGRDGRIRPIDGVSGRLLASQLIISNPDLSLRQVARKAGISPETARDVRKRLRNGETPIPARHIGELSNGSVNPAADGDGQPGQLQAGAEQPHKNGEQPHPNGGQPSSNGERPHTNGEQPPMGGERLRAGAGQRRAGRGKSRAGDGSNREPANSPAAVIERLKADPALRFTETGRSLLRLLHLHMIEADEWKKIGENIPPHCSGIVTYLAKECSQRWLELAERVEEKVAETV